jgi:hypothetical protein
MISARRAGSLCDAAARWEAGATGAGQQPSWSTTPAATPCTAWPSPGPRSTWAATSGDEQQLRRRPGWSGAVAREGIVAFDPVNGLPRYEYHGRIAFMALAGGTSAPESRVGTLPGDLYRPEPQPW